jgi:hypothetical protein
MTLGPPVSMRKGKLITTRAGSEKEMICVRLMSPSVVDVLAAMRVSILLNVTIPGFWDPFLTCICILDVAFLGAASEWGLPQISSCSEIDGEQPQ